MTVGLIAALVVAIPVILFPAAYVWYPTIGGLIFAARKARETKATAKVRG